MRKQAAAEERTLKILIRKRQSIEKPAEGSFLCSLYNIYSITHVYIQYDLVKFTIRNTLQCVYIVILVVLFYGGTQWMSTN